MKYLTTRRKILLLITLIGITSGIIGIYFMFKDDSVCLIYFGVFIVLKILLLELIKRWK